MGGTTPDDTGSARSSNAQGRGRPLPKRVLMAARKRLPRPEELTFLTLERYDTDVMEEIIVRGGRGVVASDWHLPIVSEAVVMHMLQNAKKHKATDWLIVPGDWFNFDVLSDYYPKQDDHTLEMEIQMSARLMRILLGAFDEVYVALGNHDLRLQKALGFKMRFTQSMELCFGSLPTSMRSKLHFTNLDYVLNDTAEGMWRFCHTNQYAKGQLVIPSDLADIERQHVAAGHRHHHALGYSKSGYWAVELGGLFNRERTAYLKRWSSTHPKWRNGYLILLDGLPIAPMLSEPTM